ncbi:MAG: ORF6N domain-containing protein, partial [Verrucomicrobiota bacterium]|nr:ORF6N domain-containing protein [Verrucomicrobiota bacterium]
MSGAPSAIVPSERIDSRIYLIRGQKVLLDRDLAELYGVETRILNRAVRRNIERCPGDFMFVLSREEIGRISRFGTSSNSLKYSKTVSVFTEQGVAML